MPLGVGAPWSAVDAPPGSVRIGAMAQMRNTKDPGVAVPGPVSLIACPLMHGTGQFSAIISMTTGGTGTPACSAAVNAASRRTPTV